MPGWLTSARASRGPPAGPGATPPPSASSPSPRRFPPTTFAPPPTPARSTSAKTKSRKRSRKWTQTADLAIRWHLVGHLQSNKAKKAGARFDVVQSVDDAALVAKLDEAAAAAGRTIDMLVQVDLAGEATKHGAREEELAAIFDARHRVPGGAGRRA